MTSFQILRSAQNDDEVATNCNAGSRRRVIYPSGGARSRPFPAKAAELTPLPRVERLQWG
ncbi:hypothetical protein PLANPX_6088 [Lacipirellula parvula]|uniref:Uncharacterized protein n=1 Tax=Lacipirellula parvula TaxID=2650471 RepID=A0A5K7XN88_9BACT|nr:hypothetical protein PLANPX_6088 [Lacipirellula parvula]